MYLNTWAIFLTRAFAPAYNASTLTAASAPAFNALVSATLPQWSTAVSAQAVRDALESRQEDSRAYEDWESLSWVRCVYGSHSSNSTVSSEPCFWFLPWQERKGCLSPIIFWIYYDTCRTICFILR